MKYFFLYLAAMNLIAFATCGWDKRAARLRHWRTPEKTLFLLAILGGSVGLYLGMLLFRHKTKHWYFMWGVPAIFLLEAAAFILLHFYDFI